MTAFDIREFTSLLFSTTFIQPALTALAAALLAMVIGIVLGLIGALLSGIQRFGIAKVVRGYVWIFRGTPVLIQVIFWYDGISQLTGHGINLSPFVAGVIALGFNEGAYMTEIIRSGLRAVDGGQAEAAGALGLSGVDTMRFVVAPQAMRILVPPISNQYIILLKNTSLLFVISVAELFGAGQIQFSVNYRYLEVLTVVALWYLLFTGIATFVQRRLERHFGRQDDQLPTQRSPRPKVATTALDGSGGR